MPWAPSPTAKARPTRLPAPVTGATRPRSCTLTPGRKMTGGARRAPHSLCDEGFVIPAGSQSALGNDLILAVEPGERNVHHPQCPPAFGHSVPVRPATRYQSEVLDERREPRDILGVLTRMSHFDAVQAEGDERLDALAVARLAGVREDRQTARGMNHRDGVAD